MAALRIIADIGGTSSRWAWSGGGTVDHLPVADGPSLSGFNPLNGDASLFVRGMEQDLLNGRPELRDAAAVQAYGAGCGDAARAGRLRDALQDLFPRAKVTVESDLLGAARALHGDDEGMLLILGTGMNAGILREGMLYTPMPSLGYLLGDEGSGADIGRQVLREALHGTIPVDLVQRLFPDGPPVASEVLRNIHGAASPARALAAYARPLAEVLDHPWAEALVRDRFTRLVRLLARYFSTSERTSLKALGSVAFAFRSVLGPVLAHEGTTLIGVEQDPIPGLVRYHFAGPAGSWTHP